MQFCLKSAIAVAITGLLVSCASPDEQVINEDHQYVNAQERGSLVLPEGAKEQVIDETYVLPAKAGSGDIGEDLDVQSPLQLLALASGSRLDVKNRTSKIWFDKTPVVDNLTDFTFNALRSFIKSSKIEGTSFNDVNKTAETGWITDITEGGFWSLTDDTSSKGYRFKILQKSAANGFVTSVSVKLIGHRINGKDLGLANMSKTDVAHAEINFLNGYIYHFQLLQEVLMKKAQIARTSDFTLKRKTGKQGNEIFHSAKNVDVVWVEFRTLLESLGFTVDDVDRTTKTLFVTYAKLEQGFWSSLWDDGDATEMSLAPAQYIIKVSADERQSAVTFYDQGERALSASQYRLMEDAMIAMAKKLDLEL